nr:MAG TPA_asm: hypothetical protein [Caudoviricetes sp.]
MRVWHSRCFTGACVVYEPLPITTQARNYATRGSITTAAWPLGRGRPVPIHISCLQKRKSPARWRGSVF